MGTGMNHAAWADAHTLPEMAYHREAFQLVPDGFTSAPADQINVADRWVQLSSRINAIISTVTVH